MRTQADRLTDANNVLDLGADRTGNLPSVAQINAAIVKASSSGVASEVRLPAGTYRLNRATGRIDPRSGVTIRGAGMGRTILLCDDSQNAAEIIGNATGSGQTFNPVSDFHIRDLTLQGRGDVDRTQGAQVLRIGRATNCSVENVEVRDTRFMGMVFEQCDDIRIRGCRVYRTNRDGIAVWDTSNVIITDNTIVGANDDAISVHVSDGVASPVRSGVIIANNNITESQGIRVLGAKIASITGNVMRRVMAHGISVEAGVGIQGDSSPFAVRITGNIITDVFRRPESPALNQDQYYIYVSGGPRTAGAGASPPGVPATGGAVTPLFGGDGIGTFYRNDNNQPSVSATPGGYWVEVSDNTLVRSLPAVSAWANWGFGSGLFTGESGATRLYTGGISEDQLNTNAIRIGPTLRHSRISRNTIATTGQFSILFDQGGTISNLDYDGLMIEQNKLIDFKTGGIWGAGAATAQRMTVRFNEFDADPRFVHPNRAAGGKWGSADNKPIGLYFGGYSGVVNYGNSFRNLYLTAAGTDNPTMGGNIVYADPVAVGGSLDSRGVVDVGFPGLYTVVFEDSDPTSPTYGQIKNQQVVAAASQPTSGSYVTGHFVRNIFVSISSGKILLGWKRLTTGSAHVSGTDWMPVYGSTS